MRGGFSVWCFVFFFTMFNMLGQNHKYKSVEQNKKYVLQIILPTRKSPQHLDITPLFFPAPSMKIEKN